MYSRPRQFGLEMRLEEESGVNVIYGCHPHFADTFDLGHKLVLSGLLSRRNVVGLGEIGLDYSMKNGVNMEIQKGTFKVQLRMALERKLPICLHIRDATEDGFTILEQVLLKQDVLVSNPSFSCRSQFQKTTGSTSTASTAAGKTARGG